MKELEKSELMEVDGGNQPVTTYLTSDQIAAAGDALANAGAFVFGFILGFLGFPK
jgi:hypothetical protein